jgi:hypothetical protein
MIATLYQPSEWRARIRITKGSRKIHSGIRPPIHLVPLVPLRRSSSSLEQFELPYLIN